MAPMAWNSHLLGKWWSSMAPFMVWSKSLKNNKQQTKKQQHPRHFNGVSFSGNGGETKKALHKNLWKKNIFEKKPGRIRTRSTNLEKIGKQSHETVPKNSWLAIKSRGGSLRFRTQLLLWAPISCRKPSALANKKSSHVSRGKRYLGFYSEIWCPLD